MLHKIQTLLKAIAQFFIQKPSADLTWQWVWDEDSDKPIKQDSNPWLAYYASSPQKLSAPSTSSSDWNSQKLIEFSQDKARGFLPGINPKG